MAENHPLDSVALYKKKFRISATDRIATAGSCFAQHISRHMRSSGFSVLDLEPPPIGTKTEQAHKFGYCLYSCRYGNIYTARQLLQLAQEAMGTRSPENWIWEKEGRFYDALRPTIEPNGLGSKEEVVAHRENHLRHVRSMLEQVNVFVFTFGLTETWEHAKSGTIYPTAPGTVAGDYDPNVFAFKNLTYPEVLNDFLSFRALVRSLNSDVRFIVTVSPVPLTATYSSSHVLAATIYSKSVLRAAAGYLHDTLDDVDYFPSYEVIAAHPSRGFFYDNNLRTIAGRGVEVVMRTFFAEHMPPQLAPVSSKKKGSVVCEEELLEAFS